MSLSPNAIERRARARADLRMGVPVVLAAGAVLCAVETISSERLAQMRYIASDPMLVITGWRAKTLKAHAYDGDVARIPLPVDVGLGWVRSIADPADDLAQPMKGPIKTLREGSAQMHRAGIALVKEARLLPAAIMFPVDTPEVFARTHDLTFVGDETHDSALLRVVDARLPLEVSEAGRLHIFRPSDGAEEHYAVEIGQPDRALPVLARLHSACFTGDLLGSLKCDCGPQLRGAMEQMGAEGAGVLLYLNQEGRGIGLANKMRAYSLQDQGFDTVEANHRLGFDDDERDFRIGAEILQQMGFSHVRLLTNNPAKINKLESCGVQVSERVPLKIGMNRHNVDYLHTKASKSGHLL